MARPFTVIGFTMFFTLALVFELGQKAAVVILSAAAAAFIFSLFFKSVRRDFVIPTACITAAVAVLLSFAAALVPNEASENFNDSVHTVKASVVSLEEQSGERYYTELKTSEIDGEKYKLNIHAFLQNRALVSSRMILSRAICSSTISARPATRETTICPKISLWADTQRAI